MAELRRQVATLGASVDGRGDRQVRRLGFPMSARRHGRASRRQETRRGEGVGAWLADVSVGGVEQRRAVAAAASRSGDRRSGQRAGKGESREVESSGGRDARFFFF